MRSAIAVAALAGVATAFPQVGGAPTAKAPAGCAASAPAPFQITVVNVTTTAKRSVEKRDILTLKLNNGVLTDAQNRIGSIVANYQFQFDPAPGQAGAIYTSGWSLCGNGSLALGGSAVFYQCLSGDFYNLYDRSWAAQCSPVYLVSLGSTSTGGASQLPDGQINGGTGMPVTQIGDGQIQKPTGKPISQISDGQIQAPQNTGKPVSQIGDGQIQAPKMTTTAKPVSQIGDGQVQAPKVTTTAKPVSQIGDGQIQAPVTNATRTTSAIPLFTGAANTFAAPIAAIAGVAAALAML